MVIRELLDIGAGRLRSNGIQTYSLDARVILEHLLRKDTLYIYTNMDESVSEFEQKRYTVFLDRRIFGEPIAYIVGEKEFMSLPFKTARAVLIPRPDSECVVETVMEKCDGKDMHILDLCSGSGNISISLGKYLPNCSVLGADISYSAILLSRENAKLNNTENVDFIKLDVLNNMDCIDGKFDVLVSNPPYIRSSEISDLSREIKFFEPHMALDGGADGLKFYEAIVRDIEYVLKKSGMCVFEVGYDQGDSVKKIMSKKFKNIKIIKDLADNVRVVMGELKI